MNVEPTGGPGDPQPEYSPSPEELGAEAFDTPSSEPDYAEPEEPADIDLADPNEPHDLAPVGDPDAGLPKSLGNDNAKTFSIDEEKHKKTITLGDDKEKDKTDTLSPNLSIGGVETLSETFEGSEAETQLQVGGATIDLSATAGESEKLTGKYGYDEEGARFGLTEEQFTGVRAGAKLENGDVRARASIEAGAKTTTSGEVRFDEDSVELNASIEGKLGATAKYGASWDPQGGPVSLGSTGEVFAGARAKASGGAEIDLTSGVSANVALEAFAGVEAKADATVKVGDSATAGVGVSAKAGIGATFKADAEFSRDRIGVELDIGATLGVGGNVRFDASIDPMGVIDDINDVRELAEGKVDELKDAVRDRFVEARDEVTDAAREKFDEVTDAARDKIDDVKNTVDDAKDAAGDLFNNAKDTIGGWFD